MHKEIGFLAVPRIGEALKQKKYARGKIFQKENFGPNSTVRRCRSFLFEQTKRNGNRT